MKLGMASRSSSSEATVFGVGAGIGAGAGAADDLPSAREMIFGIFGSGDATRCTGAGAGAGVGSGIGSSSGSTARGWFCKDTGEPKPDGTGLFGIRGDCKFMRGNGSDGATGAGAGRDSITGFDGAMFDTGAGAGAGWLSGRRTCEPAMLPTG